MCLAGSGLVCMFSAALLALFSHFRAAVLEAWRNKVSADLCVGNGFRDCSFFDFSGILQLP